MEDEKIKKYMVILILGISLLSVPMVSRPAHASSCNLTYANNTVEGCIVNADDLTAVTGQNVYLVACTYNTTWSTTADSNGYFSFSPTHINGTPCIVPNLAPPLTVNGVTTLSSNPCYFSQCNVVGYTADNPLWGQWAGDVPVTDSNGHSSLTIYLSPAQQALIPFAALYSNTQFASLSYQMSTSHSHTTSLSWSIGGGTQLQGSFSSTTTQAFSLTFNNRPNYQSYLAFPYYVIGYECGGTPQQTFGFSCGQGLQAVGATEQVPGGNYQFVRTQESLNPYSPPGNQPYLTCGINVPLGNSPETWTYTSTGSTATTFGISSTVNLFGQGVNLSYSEASSSEQSDATSLSISSTNGATLSFRLWPASGSCPTPNSTPVFSNELHVWDLSPAPDFSISAAPTSLSLTPGSTGTSTINLASINGFSSTVPLSVSAPSGIGVTLNPTSADLTQPSASSTATIYVPPSTAAGTYTVTVTGTCNAPTCNPSITHTVNIQVQVLDFSTWASPTSAIVYPLAVASSTITVSSLNGFSGTVNLAWAVVPGSGLSCTLNPTSITLTSGQTTTSTLSCSGSDGSYTVTVTGTSGSLSHSTTFAVDVGNFILTVNPSELDWICTSHGCNPGMQSATLQISTSTVYTTDTTFTLVYGCGIGSPTCNPTWGTKPTTITIPAGQTSGTATLTVQPGSGQSCSTSGARTDCYTYIQIIANLNKASAAQTTLTLYACHGICPV